MPSSSLAFWPRPIRHLPYKLGSWRDHTSLKALIGLTLIAGFGLVGILAGEFTGEPRVARLLLLGGILIACWFGGIVGGLVATAIACALYLVYTVPGMRELDPQGSALWTFGGFVLSAALINLFNAWRRSVELELVETTKQLNLVTNTAPAMIAYINAEQRYEFVNKAFAEWMGRTPHQMPGLHISEVLGAQSLAVVRPRLEAALKGERVEYESELRYTDGRARWLQATYIPEWEGRRVRGVFVFVLDISERKAREEEQELLTRVREELSRTADMETTARRLLSVLVPSFSDAASVFIKDGSGVRRIASKANLPNRAFTEFRVNPNASMGSPAVLRTGKPELYSSVPEELLRTIASGEEHLAIMRSAGIGSMAIAPVPIDGSTQAAISVISAESNRRFEQRHLDLLIEIGRRAGWAIHSARLYEERRSAVASLRASEQQLRLATQAGGFGVWDWDPVTDELTWSDRQYEIYGVSPQDFRPSLEAFQEAVHPEDRQISRARDLVAGKPVEGGPGAPLEYRIRRPDGTARWVASWEQIARDEDGHATRIVGLNQDVTTRKEAEARLEESERAFRMLANLAPCVVWSAAPDGRITFTNDQWYAYSGLTPEEIAYNWPKLVQHPDDYERSSYAWTKALREGSNYEIEVRNRRHDGEYRWFLTRAVPARDDRGRIIAWYGTSVDIHEMKATEDRLEKALAAKDQFLSLVSHELRTPLTVIMGNSAVLSRAGDRIPSDDRKQATDDIHREALRFSGIIENLLTMARFEQGRHIELEPLIIDRLLQQIAAEANRSSDHKIDVKLPPQPPIVLGNPVAAEQVLRNLLSNAQKYSPPGSTVEVHLQDSESDVVITVKDEGPGVSPEEVNLLFQPFYRSDKAKSSAGLGIGLTVCERLVAAMGGRIWVSAENGCGGCFSFSLPKEGCVMEPESSPAVS
jgi:PAS domain S-box-containing protein